MNELKVIETELEILCERHGKIKGRARELLLKVHDKQLWADEYKSFPDYMKQRWGVSKSQSYDLLTACRITKQIAEKSGVPDLKCDISTRAAKEISKVPEDKRAMVVEVATKNNTVTAKAVTEAIKTVVKPAKVIVEDDMGTIIPDQNLPLWNRRDEVRALVQQLSGIKHAVEAAQAQDDPLYRPLNINFLSKITIAISELRSAHPEVVCGSCEGRVPKGGCGTCRGTGFQSKKDYEHIIPEEDRNIRKAAIKNRHNATPRLPAAVSRLNP